MHVNDLVIEVTRRCNIKCDHCLRGDSENIDFGGGLLSDFIKVLGVDSINNVTLTGGEPSLVVNVIKNIRRILDSYDIEVMNFYLATNGNGNNDPKFILEMLQWYLFCTDNETSQIALSNDNYHEWADGSIELGLLSGLSFACNKYQDNFNFTFDNTINEGRANEYGIGRRTEEPAQIDIDESYIGDLLYLNCKGNVLSCCDLSYDTQDDEETPFLIDHVSTLSYESIERYNAALGEKETA